MRMRTDAKAKLNFETNAREKRNETLLSARLFLRPFACSFLFAFIISTAAFAQNSSSPRSGLPVEKSIAVDANVNVALCVAEGDLKINGWERDEIRVFIARSGGAVDFKVLQKTKSGERPVSIGVVGANSPKSKRAATADECLSGERIEIDVPRGATVSVKSRTSETSIDSVARATVENIDGGIRLSRIRQGIEATTYEGDITVERSNGAMSLTTTTGNIVALAVNQIAVGDAFRAKTASGAIVLRSVEHRQIEANSNSGAIGFAGAFLAGGRYAFNSFNGSINLQLPLAASCRINASYGVGSFSSEIPLANIVKSSAAALARHLTAKMNTGEGGATLNLSTYSGTIQIKKQ